MAGRRQAAPTDVCHVLAPGVRAERVPEAQSSERPSPAPVQVTFGEGGSGEALSAVPTHYSWRLYGSRKSGRGRERGGRAAETPGKGSVSRGEEVAFQQPRTEQPRPCLDLVFPPLGQRQKLLWLKPRGR